MTKKTKRRLPSDLTDDEARAEGERLRERLRAADRIAAPLFARQLANEEVRAEGERRSDGHPDWLRSRIEMSLRAADLMDEQADQKFASETDSDTPPKP